MHPQRKQLPADPVAQAQAWREALRSRLAEHGLTLHLPQPGRRWDDAPGLPMSADELSDAVIRMRRGDL